MGGPRIFSGPLATLDLLSYGASKAFIFTHHDYPAGRRSGSWAPTFMVVPTAPPPFAFTDYAFRWQCRSLSSPASRTSRWAIVSTISNPARIARSGSTLLTPAAARTRYGCRHPGAETRSRRSCFMHIVQAPSRPDPCFGGDFGST